MKLIFTVMILALNLVPYASLQADGELLMQDAITKPALSMRCKELHKERSRKIKIQQRLNSLLQQNKELIRKSPRAKDTLHARLESTQVKIKNELHLTNLQIENMEENIVRSGCPGIVL